ncbi:DNA topoisomerase 3 [Ruminococcaceae bacterium OttesenSCG-928-L11]|nr:DNA topoisomerase 3 [Ruminococcaceae bacterium OttesenSCG-928-L11]
MRLIICEKPSVAQAISKALGIASRKDGYLEGMDTLISWCIGHLVEMADAAAYGEQYKKWRREDLPILPDKWQYSVRADKKKQLGILRSLMKRADVDTIVNACDAGREGELIFRLVYEHCGCTKPIQRLWISSMEDAAIREGFENLRPGMDYDSLYAAALCRSQADWLVGINATRLFSCLYGATLNVGRVVTPTLALLTKREDAIAAFVKEPFYTVDLNCGKFTAASERFSNKKTAETIRAACDNNTATVLSVEKQEKTTAPPKLYDLTSLQRDANRLLGFTAQQTLDYAQTLYEKKLATYPRTDSRFLTEDMRATAGSIVNWLQLHMPFAQGIPFTPDMARVIDDAKVSDHHSIIPTMEIARADLEALPSGEREILHLIAARLLCATALPHVFETVTATVDCGSNTFTAKGRTVLREGWKAIDWLFRDSLREKPKDEDSNDSPALPELVVSQTFEGAVASIREGFTSPPKHFSEDSLLGAMESAGADDAPEDAERKGLGTPATRAATLEKLVRAGFVERKKRQLLPTGMGANLIAVLPDTVKSPQLTAEWEHRLKQVERGELPAAEFMEGIEALTRALVREHTTPDAAHAALFSAPRGEAVGQCPRCSGAVHEGKKGFTCADRSCGFALWKDNRFFASKKKTLDKKTAAALLEQGRVSLFGLYSPKTGKTYDATVIMDAGAVGDKYVNFKLEFGSGKKK